MVSFITVLSVLAVATAPLATALALPQIVDDSAICYQWFQPGCVKLCLDGVADKDHWCQTLQIDPQGGNIIKKDAQAVDKICVGGDIVNNGATYHLDHLCGGSIDEVKALINSTTPYYVAEF